MKGGKIVPRFDRTLTAGLLLQTLFSSKASKKDRSVINEVIAMYSQGSRQHLKGTWTTLLVAPIKGMRFNEVIPKKCNPF